MSESKKSVNDSFIQRMGNSLLRLAMKYMPDSTIFAIVLTVIAFILGLVLTDQGPLQMAKHWGDGFWGLLTFGMQMALIIITGSCVASSPSVRRIINRIAEIPKTGRQATWFIAFVSILISFFHWGLSLVVAGQLSKSIARRFQDENEPFEYGLFGAAAYSGLMTWGGTLSASVGLSIATPGHFLEKEMGIVTMTDYMFNLPNIFITICFIVLCPLLLMMLHPNKERCNKLSDRAKGVIQTLDPKPLERPENPSVGDSLNYSSILTLIIVVLGFVYIVSSFIEKGFSALNINMLNIIFLFLGMFLHKNVANYVRAIGNSVKEASGVIFQFPFYAGIQGMIAGSGLINIFSKSMSGLGSEPAFMLVTFLVAALVNMFVPSGGGQWAVQGPIAIASAKLLNANVIKSSLMVAYGNTWTNMAQPFWALSLFGITGLEAKDMMGYSIAFMILTGPMFIVASLLPM